MLHGGPGMPYSLFTPLVRAWEKHFTVVQWDQRGAGKTLGRTGKSGSGELSFDQLTRDGLELVEHLCAHLGQPKVILLASSIGTLVGVPMVKRRPERFFAYVGTDQNVDMPRAEALNHQLTLERLRAAGDVEGVAALEAIGGDPSRWDLRARACKQKWILKTDPFAARLGPELFLPLFLTSPSHSLGDLKDIVRGLHFAEERLFDEFMSYDARRLGLRFELPFFLFHGDHDILTPTSLAQEYFAEVDAPHKEAALIENAGHLAAFTQPEQLLRELLVRVRPLAVSVAARSVVQPEERQRI